MSKADVPDPTDPTDPTSAPGDEGVNPLELNGFTQCTKKYPLVMTNIAIENGNL